MKSLFYSWSRPIGGELTIELHEVAGIPLVSGTFCIKWRVKGVAEGVTEDVRLANHAINFETCSNNKIYSLFSTFIGRDGFLAPVELKLHVLQVSFSGKASESVGTIGINLSEYFDLDPLPRRYLLDSKFNSTLKLTVRVAQTNGDKDFKRPALNTNQICADITEAIQQATTETLRVETNDNSEDSTRKIVKQSVPRVTVKSGHMSLRRAVNAHKASLNSRSRIATDTQEFHGEDLLEHQDEATLVDDSLKSPTADDVIDRLLAESWEGDG